MQQYLENLDTMRLKDIAGLISCDWEVVNYAAKPYLLSMYQLNEITDTHHNETGHTIVAYFLANASKWRGETARAIKAELNRRLKPQNRQLNQVIR